MNLEDLEPSEASVILDPRLLYKADQYDRGMALQATASSAVNEVTVIAQVCDKEAWEEHPDIRAATVIADLDGGAIVTGRIPVCRLPELHKDTNVVAISGTQALRVELLSGVQDINATAEALNLAGHMGDGAVVGIVDFGCDFAHWNFRHQNGTTRIEAIWNQGAPIDPRGSISYGRVYESAQINAALQATDPYEALGYDLPIDSPFLPPGTHGTHVMDIAAGNGGGTTVAGVAPEATILFVDAAATDVPWQGENVVGSTFGDSAQLLEALRWIFNRAGDRPCVINVSLGTNGGPHDGTTLFERGIDALIRERPNRAVVIAAGNSYADHIHASGTISPGQSIDLKWSVTPTLKYKTHGELEIWYPASGRLELELIAPSERYLGRIGPGDSGRVRDSDGSTVIFAVNRTGVKGNGDNTIGIFLEKEMLPGTWIARLHNVGDVETSMHAWIERNDSGQSRFEPPFDDRYTLGSVSSGHETIVVGSYDAHKRTTPLSYFSSSGPTRDGRKKPEVSAPGHAVLAAWSRTRTHAIQKSGTSMAAPMVTGAIAVLLSEAKRRGISLDSKQIREIVTTTARPVGSGWDERYGFGRVDLKAMLAALPNAHPLVSERVAQEKSLDHVAG